MNSKQVNNEKEWERLARKFSEKTFLQSWAWGEFHEKTGRPVWRLAFFNKDQLQGITQIFQAPIFRQLPGWDFLYVPHGPLLKAGLSSEDQKKVFYNIIGQLRELGRRQGVAFLRVGPILEDTSSNRHAFQQAGFRDAPMHIHTENSWVLSLEQLEEDLWAGMRKGHRQSVTKARKKGVKIHSVTEFSRGLSGREEGKGKEKLGEFYRLYKRLADAVGFNPFSWEYIEAEWEVFFAYNNIELFWAEYNGEMIAASLVVFYGEAAYYHHSASSTGVKVPATHLLLWEALKKAKQQGKKRFNFWGVAPRDASSSHPWSGLTFFKQGFGGCRRDFLPTQDMPLSWKYWPNMFLERRRRQRRFQ